MSSRGKLVNIVILLLSVVVFVMPWLIPLLFDIALSPQVNWMCWIGGPIMFVVKIFIMRAEKDVSGGSWLPECSENQDPNIDQCRM